MLEEDAEHFGDGDDVLADGDFFENFLLDPLGKEDDSLLVARGAEISSFTGKSQQALAAAGSAPNTGEAAAQVAAVKKLVDDAADDRAPAAVL
jgi:hypothetical protein